MEIIGYNAHVIKCGVFIILLKGDQHLKDT